jgi:hypothetical protein
MGEKVQVGSHSVVHKAGRHIPVYCGLVLYVWHNWRCVFGVPVHEEIHLGSLFIYDLYGETPTIRPYYSFLILCLLSY